MSVFQSFQTGLALGQEQRKERDRTMAQSSAADLFKIGNYEGAESALIAIGDYQGADAYASAGKRRKDAETRKSYGEAFKTGGATGLRDAAGANADFETYGMAQGIDDSNVLRERQTKTWAQEDYKEGIAYLAQSAASLKSYPMEERGALALQALEQTPYAQDPKVRAAIEQAAADGRITDDELDAFEQQMLSVQDRMAQENWQATFDQGVTEADRSYELGRGNLAVSQAELQIRRDAAAAEAAAAKAGGNRPTKEDQNGVLRYLDGAKEPVFPDVTVAATPPKPLIGSESMGRVAAGLGNMRQAVSDLTTLVMPKDEGGQGYAPGYDWGAKFIDASLPFVGDPLARWVGGEDYQQFENAYAAFEAAALPIMSGAAVTDSEAKRSLKALRVRIGDTNAAVAAKMKNMQRMVQGLEMAAQGDTSFLQSAVKEVDAGGAADVTTMSDDDIKAALGIQ